MKISFAGTGLMGAPMVEKLLEAGHDVMVYNRTKENALPLESKGAVVAQEVGELFTHADHVLVMLADFNAINETFLEKGFVFKDKTIIQMSTIAPAESLAVKKAVEENGGNYFEAPVLGSIPQIKEKALISLVGGTKEQFDQNKNIFEAFSNKIEHIGEVGKASAFKLALNQLIIGLTTTFSMSLGFVREQGLDVEKFMDVVRNSALYAPTFDKKLDNYMKRDFSDPNFPLKHLLKDLNLMIDSFGSSNINTKTLEAIAGVLKDGIEKGFGDKDYSSLYNVLYPGG